MQINEKMFVMKKLTALFLRILLILGLAACGGNTSGNSSGSLSKADKSSSAASSKSDASSFEQSSAPADSSNSDSDGGSTSTPAQPSGKKVLVVYHSASGNTERIAKSIADAANADTFEIVPQKVYTSDDLNWTNKNSRVSREHDNKDLRDVPLKTTSVANWADYDTVLIGYPIWWGIAAWPVDNFVKANDFTGKAVIPFCTSSSSGLGQSGKLLADMAKGGKWQKGQRFSSGASDSTVKDWVNGLGLNK